jgi:hypothetical protein
MKASIQLHDLAALLVAKDPGMHCIGGWVHFRACLDVLGEGKNLSPPVRIRTPYRKTHRLVAIPPTLSRTLKGIAPLIGDEWSASRRGPLPRRKRTRCPLNRRAVEHEMLSGRFGIERNYLLFLGCAACSLVGRLTTMSYEGANTNGFAVTHNARKASRSVQMGERSRNI